MRTFKILLFFVTVILINTLSAQEIQPIRLEIERGLPNETFSKNKLEVEFWIQAENFSSINVEDTKLELFEDDTGKDLLLAHKEAVAAYEAESERLAKEGRYRFSSSTDAMFQPENWSAMRDTIGFKATIGSGMVLPAKGATKVHAVMNISFNTIVTSKVDSTEIIIPSLSDSPSIIFQRKEIPLERNGNVSRGDDRRFNIYRIPANEFPVAVDNIRVLDENGKELEKLDGMVGSNEFMVKDDYKGIVVLSIRFNPVEKKSKRFDMWFTVGLFATPNK